ncbi:3847_t:CDS:1 [Scutellospora calospora]|uniref:3847_t:CDS:1 n=1 Tax=Scutellospora calospora TaxID=85575 RepID=A0ACA9KE45_9GLOM|nr:3847_t:CDS:1 [Scutellospora calospora]
MEFNNFEKNNIEINFKTNQEIIDIKIFEEDSKIDKKHFDNLEYDTIKDDIETSSFQSSKDRSSFYMNDDNISHYDFISNDIDYINFEALRESIEAFFMQPCTSIFRIDQTTSNQIPYLVNMKDGSEYVVRLSCPNNQFHKYSKAYTLKRLQSEAAIVNYISKHTDIPTPEIYYWNDDKDNSIGTDFVIMKHLRGIPLYEEWPDLTFEEKQDILIQIIDILMTLKNLRFPKIGSLYSDELKDNDQVVVGECIFHVFMLLGRDETKNTNFGPFSTTRDFLQAALDKEIKFLDGQGGECKELRCPVQRQLAELFYDHFYDKGHDDTFVLCPSEITASKILLDRDFDNKVFISGFLAWDCTGSLPMEYLFQNPAWIRNDNIDGMKYSEEKKKENLQLQYFFCQELYSRDPDIEFICRDKVRGLFFAVILHHFLNPWSISDFIQELCEEIEEEMETEWTKYDLEEGYVRCNDVTNYNLNELEFESISSLEIFGEEYENNQDDKQREEIEIT